MIHEMNKILQQWQQMYDVTSSISMKFTEKNGILYLNGFSLCSVRNLRILSADFDAETIFFLFEGNRVIEIAIEWPEEQVPFISDVYHYRLEDHYMNG